MRSIINSLTIAAALISHVPQSASFSVVASTAPRQGVSSTFGVATRLRQTPMSSSESEPQQQQEDLPPCPTTPPTSDSECKLIICQITDVYSLEHLASFKTLVDDIRAKNPGATVVSMLTGDFLSPYLLSTVDHGAGMMNALNGLGLDYLTWGNHEADVEHERVCEHVRNFQGTFINSNMLDHEAMDHQQEYDVVQLKSLDGSQERKVGLCAVLSDDPDLYSHFPAPGAFGGATVTDPWKALKKYQHILEKEEGCDVVIPLQHLYVPDDHKTCQEFDFPLILSGHDHHCVDEVVEGTRLVKAGMNAIHAAVVEMSWDDASSDTPKVESRFVRNGDWKPDPELHEQNLRAYDALLPLRNTELAPVPKKFFPFASGNARGEVCTMGKYICTLIKAAMTTERPNEQVDAVLLMGGNIRGNVEKYPDNSFFSLETLKQEVKDDEKVAVVPMPGWLLAEGIQHTHSGDPIPGWIQYDDGVQQDEDGRVTHVADAPLAANRIYRVATKVSDLTNGQCPPWVQYYEHFPHVLPDSEDAYVNVQSEIMTFIAKSLWRRLWEHMTDELTMEREDDEDIVCTEDSCPLERIELMDTDLNGVIEIHDIQQALEDFLGFSVDERELTLATMIHDFADMDGDGKVTMNDFELYCREMAVSMHGDWAMQYQDAAKAFEKVEAQLADILSSNVAEATKEGTPTIEQSLTRIARKPSSKKTP
mmetsp:Transcript_20061/g.43178  ORF Transcript_20061/g.43178 Transcript_20061/m.43178 type:complete len:706 (-) Transcript_20061:47-2164(-)|eukprot:CAMPEP_0168809506 /NCGR_PEP_ID=MMETSP0726-20121227/3120_1 /TAXON_ID=265536 /ORGANISM="Amphiprora sp., Strain CCMP467" /LENGTH=705 /DNA_ID=CAMNT_0008861491 /DNA_START=102 /DNA_END=2219 /DNA_ORIENTATION=+